MSTPDEYSWTYNLVWKLLHNDRGATSLFARNPFEKMPPKFVRAVLYRYRFANRGNPQGLWWNRDSIGMWIRPMNVKDGELLGLLRSEEWIK